MPHCCAIPIVACETALSACTAFGAQLVVHVVYEREATATPLLGGASPCAHIKKGTSKQGARSRVATDTSAKTYDLSGVGVQPVPSAPPSDCSQHHGIAPSTGQTPLPGSNIGQRTNGQTLLPLLPLTWDCGQHHCIGPRPVKLHFRGQILVNERLNTAAIKHLVSRKLLL